jgi:hypothetical protein
MDASDLLSARFEGTWHILAQVLVARKGTYLTKHNRHAFSSPSAQGLCF